MKEGRIQDEIRLALGMEPDLVLWRNNVGQATAIDARGSERRIAYGVGGNGAADLLGILGPTGRLVAFEVKTPGGRTDARRAQAQEQFRVLVRGKGGFACVVRSASDAVAALERARKGATE